MIRVIATFLLCIRVFAASIDYENAQSAVTYDFSGGRFGDNLLAYMHAKWVSHFYKIPLIYRPFSYSSELVLDEKERRDNPRFDNPMLFVDFSLPEDPDPRTLFVVPYFPEVEWELKQGNNFYFPVDWKDPEFRKELKSMIAPIKPLRLKFPARGYIGVAVHVREGGGFDAPDYTLKNPYKIPPLDFYIHCLLDLVERLRDRNLYCHIFTDAKNPEKIITSFMHAMPSYAKIHFAGRTQGNYHYANVLEDFFSLFNFDILIRPHSNFSIVPSLIHDYAIVYAPHSFQINKKEVKTDKIDIQINDESLTLLRR